MPRVSLAIDNCFAMKRWTDPDEWMGIVRELGLCFVEASADNEIDPLFSTGAFLHRWLSRTRAASKKHGVRVANLYSGHGTYSTLGLAHDDPSVRRHIREDWIKAMMRFASRLGAGLGFFAHAFSERVLSDPDRYENAYTTLVKDLRNLSQYGEELGLGYWGLEQMYSPHQVPWTIQGAFDLLDRVNAGRRAAPLYITLDTGHQSGQRRFLSPADDALEQFLDAARTGCRYRVHLGARDHYEAFWEQARRGIRLGEFREVFAEHRQRHCYLFSRPEDGDPYAWLESFACYSPIIHLQQTDGRASRHLAFTEANNAAGLISPRKVLDAIRRSYQREKPIGLQQVSHIYLTLEVFLPTACDVSAALDEIHESVAYWRQYIPEDDVDLEELFSRFPAIAKP